MKILLLTDRMDGGGAETHVAQLALGLAEQGNEVVLLSGGGRFAKVLEARGIRQIRVKLPSHNPFRLLRLWRLVRAQAKREGFAILHAHTRLTALLLRGCARHGARAIVTVHARFSHNPILSKICYWGHHTVAVSEDLRAYVCNVYRVPAERVTVIPNAIDCTRFFPNDPQEARQGSNVLFASRLDSDCSHGAALLCRIAPTLCARYPSLSIEIAGNGDALEELRALADESNARIGRTAISLTGFVEDMPTLLRKKDIFIGVSRAALEACACGCAVILCGNEGYTGILNAENVEQAALTNFCARGLPIATAPRLEADLCTLLDAPALCQRNANDCLEWVRKHRNATQMCNATLALYHRALPTPHKRTLTVGGYFGCGNRGDDAILQGLLGFFSQTSPDLRILALTGSPHRDRKRFGVTCVSRRNPLTILRALLRSDALLFGGGSLLQDATSKRSLFYYLSLIRLAKHLRLPVLFCAAGIGPLLRENARIRVRNALNPCRYVSLRDQSSLHQLTSLGVDPSHLHLGADPALLLPPPPPERAAQLLCEHALPTDAAYLGVVLRGGSSGNDVRKLTVASIRMVCSRHAMIPLFLILDPKHDATVTTTAQKALGGTVLHVREIGDLSALLSVCKGVVSMRLHALILAASVGCVGVGILPDSRDGKIPAFANSVGMEFLPPESLCVGNLVEAIERMLTSAPRLTPILLDSVEELRKKATKDLANIVEMIYNNSQ